MSFSRLKHEIGSRGNSFFYLFFSFQMNQLKSCCAVSLANIYASSTFIRTRTNLKFTYVMSCFRRADVENEKSIQVWIGIFRINEKTKIITLDQVHYKVREFTYNNTRYSSNIKTFKRPSGFLG